MQDRFLYSFENLEGKVAILVCEFSFLLRNGEIMRGWWSARGMGEESRTDMDLFKIALISFPEIFRKSCTEGAVRKRTGGIQGYCLFTILPTSP